MARGPRRFDVAPVAATSVGSVRRPLNLTRPGRHWAERDSIDGPAPPAQPDRGATPESITRKGASWAATARSHVARRLELLDGVASPRASPAPRRSVNSRVPVNVVPAFLVCHWCTKYRCAQPDPHWAAGSYRRLRASLIRE